MTRSLQWGLAVALVVVAVAGCATMEAAKEPTLYERIRITNNVGVPESGRSAISTIVDDFVANVVADSRINARFRALQPAQVARFKANLADQLCQASGGPCSYLGRDMKETHRGMKVTEAEWSATVEAFTKALDKRKVPAKEKNELLAILGPMKGDIVGQ